MLSLDQNFDTQQGEVPCHPKWSADRYSRRTLHTYRILFNQYCRFKTELVLTFIIDTATQVKP